MSQIVKISDITTHLQDVILAARQARQHAVAPISRFLVGAAAQTRDGKIYKGANIEEAAFNASIHAEQAAVAAANAGGGDVTHIVVCANHPTDKEAHIKPCLHCWQFICCYAEHLGHVITVLCVGVGAIGDTALMISTDEPPPAPLRFSEIGIDAKK